MEYSAYTHIQYTRIHNNNDSLGGTTNEPNVGVLFSFSSFIYLLFFFRSSNVVDNNKFVMRQFDMKKEVDSTIFCMK